MPRVQLGAVVTALTLVAAACSGADEATSGDPAPPSSTSIPVTTQPTDTTPVTTAVSNPAESTTTAGAAEGTTLPTNLALAVSRWSTDWSQRTIDLEELRVGIPGDDPRDRIRPIDEPTFETAVDASLWLEDREPGLFLEIDDVRRFYPLQILTLHEIVNDRVGDTPIAVTYCPLCNTALVFDRRLDGQTLRLGVSGLLRNSDLVMWDDITQSLFQQITGEGIVGEFAGRRLTAIPSSIVRFADFREAHPDGEVLSQDTGFAFPYGVNPYEGYSSSPAPFAFDGPIDDRYPALSRVVGVTIGASSKAYPFPEISPIGAVNDEVDGSPIVVLWGAADTADALDAGSIASGRGVGAGVALSRVVDGQTLTFERVDDTTFRDLQTSSTWTILGDAIDGPLEGAELETITHRNEFWFAWTAFFPAAPVYEA